MSSCVPTSPRCRADLAATRHAEASCSSSVWARKSEAAIQAKEEAIRHAINTVSLTSVFKGPMALAETERQKTMRRQERFMELYRTAQRTNDAGGASSQQPAAGSIGRRSADAVNKKTKGSLAAAPGTAAAERQTNSSITTTEERATQPLQAPQDLLLLRSRRSGCDGEPAATGGSISRPNTARIPSAASSLAHRDGGLRNGWFRGGGGPTSFAAVAQTSRFASHRGSGSRCNGTYRSSSALDNRDIPLYSSFSADGVFHPNVKDDVQELVTQLRRTESAASAVRPVSASMRCGSSTNSAPFTAASTPKVTSPSAVESVRQEQREALHELQLLEEALGQPGSDARRSFWKRAATPAAAVATERQNPRQPLAASPPPRSLYACPADPPSGAGMYLPARPTSAPYQVAFRSLGGAGYHHSSRRGGGGGETRSLAGTSTGGGVSPDGGPASLESSPVTKPLEAPADEVDSGGDTMTASRGGVALPRRPSVFSVLAERLRAVPPPIASSPSISCTEPCGDGANDDSTEPPPQQQPLASSPSPSYSGVYNRLNLFRPRQSLVCGSGRDGSPSESSGTFVTSLDDALRSAAH